MAWLTILVELFGGFAVLVGVFVASLSVPMAAVLQVAAFTVHLPFGFTSIKLLAITPPRPQFGPPGYETDLLYLACLAALVMGGSGPRAADTVIAKWPRRTPTTSGRSACDPCGRATTMVDAVAATGRAGRHQASPASLAVGGVAVLFGSWLVMALVAFLEQQFHGSQLGGWLTALSFLAGAVLLSRRLVGEWRSYRELQQVERLRLARSREDISPAEAVDLCRPWLISARQRFATAGTAEERIGRCNGVAEIRVVLQIQVADEMRKAAHRAGRRAAMEGGALIAITPSPLLDGVIAALRGAALIRQVAAIYGIRPGTVVTYALLRRVARTAASVSGVDLLSQPLADGALHNFPVLKHLLAAMPGASLGAMRLYRLADITAEACSPLPHNRSTTSL